MRGAVLVSRGVIWEAVNQIQAIAAGYSCPEICTPLELLQEDEDNVER